MLIDTRLVPGPLLFSSIVLTVLTAHRERRSIDFRERRSIDFHGLKWALSGRVVGTMVGISTLLIVSRNRIATVFGVVVLLTVAMSASGLHLRPVRWTLLPLPSGGRP
jgi:uncharacterized membrane protein YfcA